VTYPTNIPDWLNAARAYVPPAEIMEAFYTAVYQASPVLCIVDAFKMLRDRNDLNDLNQDGLKVLIGAADLIRRPGHDYHGLAAEAATLIGQRAGELADEPADQYEAE
jgi:hypothetical protein